jgi:hypothetical protein
VVNLPARALCRISFLKSLLVKEIADVRYDPDTVIEYGRIGQRQNGVDVYAEDRDGKRVGIQCKETKQAKLPEKTIEEESQKAKAFNPKLDLFVLTTTMRRGRTRPPEFQEDTVLGTGKYFRHSNFRWFARSCLLA